MKKWLIKKLKGYTKEEMERARKNTSVEDITSIFMAHTIRNEKLIKSCVNVITNFPTNIAINSFIEQFSIRQEDIKEIRQRPPSITLNTGTKYMFNSTKTFHISRFKGSRTNGFIFFNGIQDAN